MKAKSDSFPLTVKAGSTAVKIYRDSKPSGDYFRVVYHLGGKRHRLNFRDLDRARAEARAKAAQLARGDVDAVQLTGKDRLAYGRALDAVKDFGIPLDAAAIDYAEARRILGGHPLTEAARFFMRHHGRGLEGKPVAEAVEAFKAEKRVEGRSELYLDDLRYRLDGFAKAFNVEVRQLTPADVRDFLNELKFSARSFNNHRRALQTFFNFVRADGWLSRERTWSKASASGRKRRQTSRFSRRRSFEGFCMRRHRRPQPVSRCKRLRAFVRRNCSGLRGRTWNVARALSKSPRVKPRRRSGA